MILTIRTDKPDAEIGLMEGRKQLAYETWLANRQLADSIHLKIAGLLRQQKKDIGGVKGIICYKGPGSFTGLRIGLTVGNALAHGLGIPIVAEAGEDWQQKGMMRLQNQPTDTVALPEYGAPVHTTRPKK